MYIHSYIVVCVYLRPQADVKLHLQVFDGVASLSLSFVGGICSESTGGAL